MLIKRRAVRAVLLTEQHEILLIHIIEPSSKRIFWILPGGGIEAGEGAVESLKRELLEEVGQGDLNIGPQIWQRDTQFSWEGQQYYQVEQIFLVPVKKFFPTDKNMPDQGEIASFNGFRWWSLAEIEQATEIFAPRKLAAYLRLLIKNGPPAKPLDIGI